MTNETPEIIVPELTNEFVSKLIGQNVKSFSIKPGTAPGDNYMSVLYCFKCILVDSNNEEEKIVYGISKCYPSHPVRQQFLNKSNIFWNELCIYKEWIPAMKVFRPDLNLPFAPFISGEGINFGIGQENKRMVEEYKDKSFSPFDIYIMMVDLKNTFGFRMADRMLGLGYDEMVLVMKEYAKIHAVGWAYKIKHGVDDIGDLFPSFRNEINEEDMVMWMGIMNGIFQNAYDSLLKIVTPEDAEMLEGVVRTKNKMREIVEAIYGPKASGSLLEDLLRVKPHKSEELKLADDVPWQVVVHGDCWINNLLFRYDPKTKMAIELILVDLQAMREACPTTDLTYVLYSSVDSAFRTKHLDEMLKLYADQFILHCDEMGVEYLPGFSFEALKRRFHRSKLSGLITGMMLLPVMFKDAAEAPDMENFGADKDLGEMFTTALGGTDGNVKYQERLLELTRELYNEGII